MTIRFACGHEMKLPRDVKDPPKCQCGETRVTRCDAPKPRFTMRQV